MIKHFFQNIRKEILSELNQAEKEIIVAVYWFTNHELFEKLCERKQAGFKVELIVHNNVINNRETGNRSRMKIFRINPNKDLPIKTIENVLQKAPALYRKGTIKIKE